MILKFKTFLTSSLLAAALAQAQTLAPSEKVSTAPTNSFVALCYHDVSNGFVGNNFSLRQKDLVTQFDYLKAHYNVVSLQDLIDASEGRKTLPPKAVLITVDDGLASFYENVYPLLKEYKFKATFAIVGKWIDDGVAPDYGFKDTNPKMVTWKQLKEMSDSGFVDVISHTYDMHQSQVFNPQGNRAPVASFFKYDLTAKTYQTEADMASLVEADLKKNNELIKKHLGKDNKVLAWPYGASNALSRKAAENAGLTIQMTLRSGLNNTSDLSQIGRGLMFASTDISQFAASIEQAFVDQNTLRMIRVDLDSFWKKSESETEKVLGDLLEEALALGPNAALLQAVSDSGEAYFATSQMKVKGNYLSRVAHTIKYRARVPYVYARVPQSFLKDSAKATAAVVDLAKYTDIDGVFFEISERQKNVPFDAIMAAGRSIRPRLQFGVIGTVPPTADLFDYVVVGPKQATADQSPAKRIVALAKDYKMDASHSLAQGYKNLFFDVNFKGFVPDADFKNLFSVRNAVPLHTKGEVK